LGWKSRSSFNAASIRYWNAGCMGGEFPAETDAPELIGDSLST